MSKILKLLHVSHTVHILTMVFCCALCSTVSADEYMNTALCGWGDLNEIPCQDISRLKIYTAVPREGNSGTDKMKMLNFQVSAWIKNNKNALAERKLETQVSNLWAKHYFPPTTKKEEVSVAVFMYTTNNKMTNLVFISQTVGSVQVLSFDCNSENYKDCMSPLIEKGMKELLKYLLYKN